MILGVLVFRSSSEFRSRRSAERQPLHSQQFRAPTVKADAGLVIRRNAFWRRWPRTKARSQQPMRSASAFDRGTAKPSAGSTTGDVRPAAAENVISPANNTTTAATAAERKGVN